MYGSLLEDLLYFLTRFLSKMFFIAAIAVAMYQTFLWLDGEAVVLGADLFFKFVMSADSSFVAWLNTPESSLGLHRFLTLTPLSLFLFLLGWSLERLVQ